MTDQAFILANVARWRADPVAFVREVLGIEPWAKQIEILESVRDNPRTCVPSGHGVSKTHTAACVTLWFNLCFMPSKVITTAPSKRQVEELLWSEIRTLHGGAKVNLGGQLDLARWKLDNDWFAVGITTRPDAISESATRFQGYHSPNLLVIVDEAAGMDPAIHEAIEGLLTSATVRVLEIGNPTGSSGPFVDHIASTKYHTIRIDCEESPNVVAGKVIYPYLVTADWVDDMREKWGRDSPVYKSRVRGLVPEQATNALISMAWVIEALQGKREVLPGMRSMGVDVARFGDDSTVMYVVEGSRIIHADGFVGQDTTKTAGQVAYLAKKYDIPGERVAVDDTGVGGGVTDQLRNTHHLYVMAINFSQRATSADEFYNARAEIWWALARWLEQEASLDDAPHRAKQNLPKELPAPTYDTSTGTIRLEPKDRIKKRIGRSPDDGDALALALAWRTARPAVVALSPRKSKDPRAKMSARDRVRAGSGSSRRMFSRKVKA